MKNFNILQKLYLYFFVIILCFLCGCQNETFNNIEYTTVTVQTKKIEDYDDNIHKTVLSEKLKSEFNLSAKEIQKCLDNSYFEELSYSIDFVKSFDDHQVRVPVDIPFTAFFDIYLWKCENYVAVINIENVSVQPKNAFKFTDEKIEVPYWFQYSKDGKFNSIKLQDDNIIMTSFKEPTQLMLGFSGLEIENTKNKEIYKNFPIYVYFSVPALYIK